MSSIPIKPRFRPIIWVFVSSTFSDLVHERNALQDRVWPELEQYGLLDAANQTGKIGRMITS